MAMQGSWAASPQLSVDSFLAKIQAEVAHRGLAVLSDIRRKSLTEEACKQKARQAVKQWLDCKYGSSIPEDRLASARKLFSE